MEARDFVLVQGLRDTRATLERWNARPGPVLWSWLAGSLAVVVALLLAVWGVALLSSPEWKGTKMDFYGGQAVNEVLAKSANAVRPYEWSPFQDYVYTQMSDQLGSAISGKVTFEQAMHNLQNNVVNYAKSQGFTVTS